MIIKINQSCGHTQVATAKKHFIENKNCYLWLSDTSCFWISASHQQVNLHSHTSLLDNINEDREVNPKRFQNSHHKYFI